MTRNKPIFAPREVFEKILEYAVIPTFDIIVDFQNHGVIILRRKIAPYKNTWALPGLRMMKPEGIEDTIKRIAMQEIGITIDFPQRKFIGQYVGRFRTENYRQDISTCYAVRHELPKFNINPDHFSNYRFIQDKQSIPSRTGAMYKFFLETYFDLFILPTR